jgi:DNA adenine methylase
MDSALKWHGGKHYLAKKIVAMMPEHIHYVEPYAGSLAVLLERDPNGYSEVVNDLHGELTNFWRVLQFEDSFDEFKRLAEAMPFSEPEFTGFYAVPSHPTTRALGFFVRCRQSRAGCFHDFATLSRTRTRRGMNEQASAWISSIDSLPAVHARLRRVVILNRDALDVIAQQDSERTLFYLDPPYLHSARKSVGQYDHEMTAERHLDLLEALSKIRGKFLLSGYRSDLYDSMASMFHWQRAEFKIANSAAGGKTKKIETECVWSNFEEAPIE